jgi:hypothetical protein
LKLGSARVVIVVEAGQAKVARGEHLLPLFSVVREMFSDYCGLEASCLIAITKLPLEESARNLEFSESSMIIQNRWQQNRSSPPLASSSLGQQPQLPDPPQTVAINPSGDPTEILKKIQKLHAIPNPSTLFVPKLSADIKEKLLSVLRHVRDQVRTCLSNRFHSDVFSLLNLLDKFASFKLQEAVNVKHDAVAEITGHVSALATEISRLSRTSESNEERKDDRYREHFQRIESLCELFDNVCNQKLSPILHRLREEISSIELETQNRELVKLKVNAENGFSKLSGLLQLESNSVSLKNLIASNCETYFLSSYCSNSLLDFLTSLTSASVTSAELKSAAIDMQSALDALSNRPFLCCKMYMYPRDDDVRRWYSEFRDLACHELSSVGQKLSLAFREAELHIIEAKILGKMDEILEKSGDAVLCRQIGTNVVKNMLVCGLTASEQQALHEFDKACKLQDQFHVQPGKKFGPQMTTVGSATDVSHFALHGLPLRSIPSPPSSLPSLKCGHPPATSKKQPGPALFSGSSQFYERFKIRIDVASCKKCLRWVTKLKDKIFQHCDAVTEWLESLTEIQMHHPDAEYSTILGEVRQAIRTLYDETTVKGWIERKEFSLLSSTFVEIHALQSAIQKYLPDLKVNEFLAQVYQAVQQLYHSALQEITAYFASSEFGGKVQIASFKTFLEWNQAFQRIESLKEDMKKLVHDFKKGIEAAVMQVCQRRFDGHRLCMFILKLLYLEDNLRGVNISENFVVEQCKNLLKLQTEGVISAAGHEISAISHDELRDVASKATRTFQQFKSIYVSWFNSKASAKTFDTVLKQLEERIKDSAPSKLSSESKEVLGTCYKKVREVFDSRMFSMSPKMHGGAAGSTVDQILGAIKVAVQNHARDIKKSPGVFGRMFGQEVHFHDCREIVAQLLGNIFAAYSLLEGAAMTDDKMNWLQPHPTQIACILMLLGIGSGDPKIKNQLAEVGTGEGKSIILGMLGLFFALLGKKVHIVCYNPFLSSRDAEAFAKVFHEFRISSSEFVTPEFCTISGLYEQFVKEGVLPNLRECVEKSAKNESFSSLSVHDKSNRVLLIDEVDVFFGQDFYGQLKSTGHIFVDSNSKGLVSYAFNKRESINSSTIDSSIPELMSTEYARNFQRTYPNLDLRRHLQRMLGDLKLNDFPVSGPMGADQQHVLVKAKHDIGYVHAKTSSVVHHEYRGYKTFFAYLFHCRVARDIDETQGSRHWGITINTGYQMLSDLPQYCGILLGVSGTVSKLSPGDHEILRDFDFSRTITVPSTFNKQPLVQDSSEKGFTISFGSETAFFADIIARIKDVRSQSNRPMLVILKDSSTLKSFAQHFRRLLVIPCHWRPPEILNEETAERDRPRLIASATTEDTITLVTRSYGRGSDFVSFSRAVNDKGGVHVILTFLPELLSEMVQIKGRTCRQDNKGSFEEIYWKDDICNFGYVSADELDSFISTHSSMQERQMFLYEKRNDHDRNRTNRMKENLRGNRVFANRTMDMLEAARNDRPREAIDIAYEWTFK